MKPISKTPDILVIGGGNAALAAAITAGEAGCRVVMLEVAPPHYRGGNSRHTRNFRCMHDMPCGTLTESYGEEEYFNDLIAVTKGKTDEALARFAIRESRGCYDWMAARGVHFQPSLKGTLSLSRTNAFFLGGGKALVNTYYAHAESLGVEILYEAEAVHLERDGRRIVYVDVRVGGSERSEREPQLTKRGGSERSEREPQSIKRFTPKAVVVASGGFEANLDWLAEAWGPPARNFIVRGTPYNRGAVLRDLLAQDLASVGDATQCHAVAIDGRAPKFDGGIVTRLDCVPFSVVVNKKAQRFYDEGEDVWPKRYAIWGRLVAAQPDQVGYALIDSKAIDLFMPSVFPPIVADSIGAMAKKLQLPRAALEKTISEFNAACKGDMQNFTATELDALATTGINPPKTNWARPLDTPPYYGYELRPGVTFTYLGLKVGADARARVASGEAMENLFAAGEIMAGSILGEGYLAGFGMTIGTVFGRVAGKGAAQYAKA